MSEIRRVLADLEAADKAATTAPWSLLWEEPNSEAEGDPPDVIGIWDHADNAYAPLVRLDYDHPYTDEAPHDLVVVEKARNAFPLLIAVARAAHTHVSGPDAGSYNNLVDALDGLLCLLPAKPKTTTTTDSTA